MLLVYCVPIVLAFLMAAYVQKNDTATQPQANRQQQLQIEPYAAKYYYDTYAAMLFKLTRSIAPECGLVTPRNVSDMKISKDKIKNNDGILRFNYIVRRLPSEDGAYVSRIAYEIRSRLIPYCEDMQLVPLALLNMQEFDRYLIVSIGGRYGS